MFVALYCNGSPGDAKAIYGSMAGASDTGWQQLEKMLAPVRSFIQDSGMPYTAYAPTTEYAGIPVPEPEAPPLDGGSPPPESRSNEPNLVTGGLPPASELIAQAKVATTQEELDEIEAQAGGRVTVLDAVTAREEELTKS